MSIATLIAETRIKGQKLRYAVFGSEDAAHTLLLFNGIGARLETIAPVAGFFRDTRIVTFDVPGVGGSPTPPLPYRFHWIARLAAGLLDELGMARVDVMGLSWGGGAAQQFAQDYPRRVRGLILAATSAGFVMVPGNLSVLTKMVTPRRYTDPNFMKIVGPMIYGGRFREDAALLDAHTDAIGSGQWRGYLYQLMAGSGWTSWLWLPRITAPTLILMGEDDPIVPPVNGRMMAGRLPNARLKLMDCGHLFALSDPKGTAQEIEDFLNELDPANQPDTAAA